MDGHSVFLDYIGRNYDNIHGIAKSYSNYNADVFQQTILNCDKTVMENSLVFPSDNDMLRYFLGAYKMNLLRDKMYYRSKNVTSITSNTKEPCGECGMEAETQIDMIHEDLEKTFSTLFAEVYIRYCKENISIQKLQAIYGIKNLKQRIRDMREHILMKFNDFK